MVLLSMSNLRESFLSRRRSIHATMALLPMVVALVAGCHNNPYPDKTLGGAVLGAGWGAGTGAVIGNQVSNAGEGAAVGAGFGLVSGAMAGLGYDVMENDLIEREQELTALRVQNDANGRALAQMQAHFDREAAIGATPAVYQVFFEADETGLKAGAIANLEVIAEAIRRDPRSNRVHVVGHSDDTGDSSYNERLAQSRARSVTAYLAGRGISMDQIILHSYGSKRPIASNATAEGRQLNRRVDLYVAPASEVVEPPGAEAHID